MMNSKDKSWRNLVSRVATLSYLKCKILNKITAHEEIEKHGPRGEKKQLTGTVLEEDQALDLLNKDFKSAVLNTFKELKKICVDGLIVYKRLFACQHWTNKGRAQSCPGALNTQAGDPSPP